VRKHALPRPQGAEVGSTRLSAFRFPFLSFLPFPSVIASEAKQSSAVAQGLQPLRSARPRWIASSLRSSMTSPASRADARAGTNALACPPSS
jgi:hypothetical protein